MVMSSPDTDKMAKRIRELEAENNELRENMGQTTTLSTSQVCAKYHWKACHCCEDARCAHNETPSIVKLKAEKAELLDALKVGLPMLQRVGMPSVRQGADYEAVVEQMFQVIKKQDPEWVEKWREEHG